MKASKTYHPGDLVHEEEAFARVLSRDNKNEKCEFCCKSSKSLIACNDCSEVKYCSIVCRANDSDDHRKECANIHKLGGASEDVIRLLGRIIFKIKGKDWKEITKKVMDKEVSFDDVDPHYDEMTRNPRLVLQCKELKKSLKEFIGEENMPAEDDLIKIFGKIKFSGGSDMTVMLCFGIRFFDHECIPNCNIELSGTGFKVWALKKIDPSEKLTISIRSILTTHLIRVPLDNDSQEVCKCSECSMPYGESPLTKIIDEERAYFVIRLSERVIRTAQVLSQLGLADDFRLRILVDTALEKHEGVLGPTNALHLKLLAIKAFQVEGMDVQRKMTLIELEKHMVSVFGEYYLELERVYKALVYLNFKLGNLLESAYYIKKKEKVDMHKDVEKEEEE